MKNKANRAGDPAGLPINHQTPAPETARLTPHERRILQTENETKYRKLIETTGTGYLITDSEGRVIEANKEYIRLSGHKDLHQILGRPVTEWTAARQKQKNAEALAKCIKEGFIRNFTVDYVDSSGRITPVEISATTEGKGKAARIISICRDISDRRQAEAALRESEAEYRTLYESSRDALMTLFPPEWRFTSCNNATVKLFEAKDEAEFTASEPWALSPEHQPSGEFSAAKGRRMIETAMKKGSHSFEWTHRKIGGTDFPATVLLTKVELNGKVGLQATVRDITERQKLEEELKISHDRLSLFSEMDSILLRCQGENMYSEMTGLFARTFHADCVFFGYIDSNGYCIPPRLPARCEKALNITILPARFKTDGNQPFLFAKALANTRPVRTGAQPGHCTRMRETLSAGIRFNRKTVGFISLGRKSRDFSDADIKRLEQLAQHLAPILNARLEKQKQETENQRMAAEFINAQKIEALGVIAGGIAHDFNNMLAGIMGNLSLLDLELPKVKKKWRKMIAEAIEATENARHLAGQLITFSRGGMPVRKKFSLGELSKKAALFAARGSNCSLKFEIQKGLWLTDGDEVQLAQTIHNLIINSVQAMSCGGRIEVAAVNELVAAGPHAGKTRYVKLSIRDHGSGIAPENAEKIFEPFFSTKTGGRGLGLTMAHTIIKRHDGHITIQSEPGKGSCFTIRLPAAYGTGAAQTPGPRKQRTPKNPGRMLLLEDDAILVKSLCGMLRRLGYTPLAVGTGKKLLTAYAAAEKAGRPFKAVIMDLMIPGAMGGEAAVRRLKKLYPEAKVIVSSGHLDSPVMRNYRACGFDGILAKPYKYEVLAEALAGLFGKSQRSR